MNYLHRHRRSSNAPPRRTRSRSNDRNRSTSPERHHRQSDRRHDHNRRHRHADADRAKRHMMDEHTILRELQRRYDVSIEKIGRKGASGGGGGGGGGIEDSPDEGGTWIFLAVSTSIVLVSLVTFSSSSSNLSVYSSAQRNRSIYLASLSLCSIQLSLALFGTAFILYDRFGNRRRSQRTPRHTLTFLSLIIQSIINFLVLGPENYFAVTGLSILNYNMFYGSWVSFGLVSFLSGRLNAAVFCSDWTSFDTRTYSNSQLVHHRCQFGRQMTVLWTMHLLFQLCTFSSSISIKISPICGGMLGTTAPCQGVSTSVILSLLNIIFCILCLFGSALSFWRRYNQTTVRLYGVVGFLSLILQSATTGILTSEGGMGSNPGNLFVTTWTNTVLGLIILLRCIDGYLSSPSSQQNWLERPCVEGIEKGSDVMAYPIKTYPIAIMPPPPLSVHKSIDTPSTEVSEDEEGEQQQQRHKQQGKGAFDNNATMRPQPQANFQERALPVVPLRSRANPTLEQKRVRKRLSPPPQQAPVLSREAQLSNSRPKLDPQGSIACKNHRRSTESRGIQDTIYYHSTEDIAPSSVLEPEDYFSVGTRTDSDFVSSAKTFIRKSPSGSYAISDKRRRQPSKSRSGRDPSMVQPSYNSIGNTVVNEDDTAATEEDAAVLRRGKKSNEFPAAAKPSRQQMGRSTNSTPSRVDTASSLLDSGNDYGANSNVFPTKHERGSALPSTKRSNVKSLTSSKPVSATRTHYTGTEHASKKSLVSGISEGKKSQTSSKSSDDHDVVLPAKHSQRAAFPKQSSMKNSLRRAVPIGQGLRNDGMDDTKTAVSSRRQLNERNIVSGNASCDSASDSDSSIDDLAHNDPDARATFSASRQSTKTSMGTEEESDDYRLLGSKHEQTRKPAHNRESHVPIKKMMSDKQPIARKPSLRDKADSNSSYRRSGIARNSETFSRNTLLSREPSPFNSKLDRKVTAVAAKAMPAPRRESQQSNVSSTHTPVTTDDEEDSGVETVSTDSDYSGHVKHASSHSLKRSHHDLFPNKKEEAEKQREHPLDFEYRPMSSSQNFHASFNRRQILTEFFDPWRQNSAPVQTICAMDESIISDPTLDNSIRTTRTNKATQKSDNDEGVRAAIDRATMARKSRRLSESMGKIAVEGRGNTENVDEIVAAAIAAASKQRSILNIPPPPPPPNESGRRINNLHASIPPPPLTCDRKKSLPSNFSAELFNQLFASDPIQNAHDESSKYNYSHESRNDNSPSIHSFYSNSKSGTESMAQC